MTAPTSKDYLDFLGLVLLITFLAWIFLWDGFYWIAEILVHNTKTM